MENSKRGYIIAASVAAVLVAGGIYLLLFFFHDPSGLISTTNIDDNDVRNDIAVATADMEEAPKMVLTILEGDEDSSKAIAQYDSNNTKPIALMPEAHIRFDSPDYRTAESMKVVARDLDTGTIHLLRKSYDVNNEFFVNLDNGSYQLQVQATWFEAGSQIYKFNIIVS